MNMKIGEMKLNNNVNKFISCIMILMLMISFNSCTNKEKEAPMDGFVYNDNVFKLGMSKSEIESKVGSGTSAKVMFNTIDGVEYNSVFKVLYQEDIAIYFETQSDRVKFYNGLNMFTNRVDFLESYMYETNIGDSYTVVFLDGVEVNRDESQYNCFITCNFGNNYSQTPKIISLGGTGFNK